MIKKSRRINKVEPSAGISMKYWKRFQREKYYEENKEHILEKEKERYDEKEEHIINLAKEYREKKRID